MFVMTVKEGSPRWWRISRPPHWRTRRWSAAGWCRSLAGLSRCTPDYLSRSAGLAASSGVTRAPPQTLPLPVAHAALLPLTAAGEAAPKTPPPAAKASAPAAPVVDSDTLPPLRYSAHVYASLAEKRSIVLNGKAWTEGDSPLPNLVVEQIQQDVTIFSFNGTTFTLAALEDWPGGKIDEEPKGE